LLAACNNSTPPASGGAANAAPPAAAPAASSAVEFGAPGVAPRFEVDPLWPKPLPNHWLLGSTIGVSVDSRDHVWIIHRQQSLNLETEASAGMNSPAGTCCMPAPNVIEFDAQGNVVGSWGGPGQGYDWPTSNHGITVDHMDNVWIGGNDRNDAHVLKFHAAASSCCSSASRAEPRAATTREFRRVREDLDRPEGQRGLHRRRLRQQARRRHRRATGKLKRYWGAYGNGPTTRTSALRSDGAAASSSESRCTAPSRRTTASSTFATASTIAFRCSRRTARS
jgi:hypothetical protein